MLESNAKPFVAEGWYAVALSKNLKKQPISAKIMGQNYVIFRGLSGQVIAAPAACPHMGVSLATGKFVDGNIICPYHGFAFGEDGRCTVVPAISEHTKFSRAVNLNTLEAKEAHGLIWIYLSAQKTETEQITLPPLAEYNTKEFSSISGSLVYPVEHSFVIANSCDFAHIQHVHPEFADPTSPQVEDFEITDSSEYSATAEITFKRSSVSGLLKILLDTMGEEQVRVGLSFYMPSTNRVELSTGKLKLIAFVSHTPVSPFETITYFTIARNFAHHPKPIMDAITLIYAKSVVSQDRGVLSNIIPRGANIDQVQKCAIPADRLILEYRKRRKAFNQLGRCL